jgi:hypothetical protein
MWWKIAGVVEQGIRAACSCINMGKGYTSEFPCFNSYYSAEKRISEKFFGIFTVGGLQPEGSTKEC